MLQSLVYRGNSRVEHWIRHAELRGDLVDQEVDAFDVRGTGEQRSRGG